MSLYLGTTEIYGVATGDAAIGGDALFLESFTPVMPDSLKWGSISYGNGVYVAVSSNTNLSAYSVDGIRWYSTTLPYSADWHSVTYGDGKFVTVSGDSNYAAYSADGITWTETTLPSSATWRSVTYGNGKFVAISNGSDASAYSVDGINWVASTLPVSTHWCSITYGDDKFVVVSNGTKDIAYSADGITWTAAVLPFAKNWRAVVYGNDKFVAVGNGVDGVAYSYDGTTWISSTLPSNRYASVVYGDSKFVALGQTDVCAYSTDGINWTTAALPLTTTWYACVYANSKFTAVPYGYNTFATSNDGITWASSAETTITSIVDINGNDVTERTVQATGLLDNELATQDNLIAQIATALEGKTVAGGAEVIVGNITKSVTDKSITIIDLIGKDNVALMYIDACDCPASAMEDSGVVNVVIHGESQSYNIHYSDGLFAGSNDGFIIYDKTTGYISINPDMSYNERFIAGKYMYVVW